MADCMEQGCGCQHTGSTCTNISEQYADVSLLVKVTPSATIGKVQTDCCGDPVVTVRQTCGCGSCEITIMQSICIRIPVEYQTMVEAGEPEVNCKHVAYSGAAACR